MKDQIPDPQHWGRKQVKADPDPHFLVLPNSDDPQSEEPEQEVDDENQELEAAVAAWEPHFTPTLGKRKNTDRRKTKQRVDEI